MENYVYWIYDDNSINPTICGYVGVSKEPNRRFKTHLRKKRVHADCKLKILFSGSRQQCFDYERTLRPYKQIGWNNAVGGSHGWRIGFSHTEEAKLLMKAKWTTERKKQAAICAAERNRKLIGQKRPKQSAIMTGSKNPMYGTTRPLHVRQAVSKAHKGKKAHNLQETYCVGCHKRVQQSRLLRSHTKCFNQFSNGKNIE